MRIISLVIELKKKKKASGSLTVSASRKVLFIQLYVFCSQSGTWPKKYASVFMELNSDLACERMRSTPRLYKG